MGSWFSKETPEEKAANRADREASRAAINGARSAVNTILSNLKKEAAKEDYPILQKMFKDLLNWLKANPTVRSDDINDYYVNNIQLSPLNQSIEIRKQWEMGFTIFELVTNERLKTISIKHPELLSTAKALLAKMNTYRDSLLKWFREGREKFLAQDYLDKAVEMSETIRGEDGKQDVFGVEIFMDDEQLKKHIMIYYMNLL
jgi:hypothetical protein